jgi:hypothetical protein
MPATLAGAGGPAHALPITTEDALANKALFIRGFGGIHN